MLVFSNTRRETCRYFALGPCCPNGAACESAHWDAGRLASHERIGQRGTCLAWKHNIPCGIGLACRFEHRETGVTGLGQATIELEGFALQVADAAAASGFNTFAHEALFNLIWAVKQVALRNSASNYRSTWRPPPPKHPIYPDRYRPGGFRDNTNKKKKADTLPPPFHPIKPLMRKRAFEDPRPGEPRNVIDLTADSDPEDLISFKSPSPVKRQKLVARGPTAASSANTKSQRTRRGRRGKGSQTVGRNALLATSFLPLTAANAVPIVPRNPQIIAPKVPQTITPRDPQTDITTQLLSVKARLEDAKMTTNACQATMKEMFDRHAARFDNDEMMDTFRKLNNHMNRAYDGGNNGAMEVDRAIALLNDSKDGIL